MFERFTDGARQVVTLAQGEARALGHGYIGTEHLLLALIGEGDGVAAQALLAAGVAGEAVRTDVLDILGEGRSAAGPGPDDLVGPADADALRAIGIDVDSIRERIEESFGPGVLDLAARRRRRGRRLQLRRPRRGGRPCSGSMWPVRGHIPFTPRSKKVLESRSGRPSTSATTTSAPSTSSSDCCGRARGWPPWCSPSGVSASTTSAGGC